MKVFDFRQYFGAGIFVCLVVLAAGCTVEKTPVLKSTDTTGVSLGVKSDAVTSVACAADELTVFDQSMGYVVDLDREVLPRGVYLARTSELLVEKKFESGTARALAREIIGGKGAEIICSENLDKFGLDFDMVMNGLVKFDTTEKPLGSGFVLRQFYFFQDKSGFGVVLSNPRSSVAGADLHKLLSHKSFAGQLVRLSDRQYVLKYQRERDGARARLLIWLDLVP